MAQVQVPPQNAIPGANGAPASGGANQFVTTSLYVGDLDVNVTDSQLYDLFSQAGQVVSVRVCRDLTSRRSLGYGYVNFNTAQEAARALDLLNFTPLNNKPIRVMYSHRDPSIRKSGAGNIFIKNLDKAIDHKALHDTFSAFGNILSCKVATDSSGQSKGYGFVQFDNEESAQKAIEKLNGMLLNDKQVYVGPFLRKQERDSAVDKTKFNNVFVKNLSESTTDEDLKKSFGEFGTITSAVVMRDGDGKSKCFGFVNFENAEDAARAVDALNGKKIDDKEWYVGKAQKKSERELELKIRFEQSMKEAADKYQGANLYVKNLDDSIGDDKLRELFSPFGTITSCKVMRDPNGISRGSGFVAFSTPEEASRALLEMNGKMVVSKPLYVALAQRKEDRRARLQAQFAQMRPVAITPSVAPRVPMYPPGGPGIGQQIFYGQGPPAIIPSQPGFGYQQQLVPGMRPGGGRRAGAVQQNQQPMLPRGRVYRYPPGRGLPDVPMPGVAGGMFSVPYDIPIGALASALANATPEQQRTMLGENLYPLVEQLEPDNAAKVTGMLLEMDQTEVLHLLESPEALKAKVAEAMDVLRNVAQQQQPGGAAEQLASLSLNDNLVS
ncbi:polyadenylate-binding protein 2-like [Senna tora]|uniref:Polyadenylate-binding protein n=1 Tax=Senna tora TaxID=362788 RepID=A0A834SZM5_9FABA|nr:polyadenylate-binding protein 2-like [Senna tora]